MDYALCESAAENVGLRNNKELTCGLPNNAERSKIYLKKNSSKFINDKQERLATVDETPRKLG